ncbi:XRE family transcriptional regulator [Pseudoalteromonas rubra]|uniref:XRE family transcriptional regulator n=1 Tax=Pseudoalteromonas rubra TaxID=43658 RepID=A0A5S3WTY8_9GAMM|nr:helix-turn-helix transcriptional regulator [Pseudoalteromonas rubra]TMP31840.1 XRE family transcriptional regulator [Pseudoalteromonas rubra]TMP33077.1 XRE family transcriptional regulator [Pseudoalteromonas rubra]
MTTTSGKRKKEIDKFKLQLQRSIRQMRQEMGLSQRELAAKMTSKVDQSTVSNWESGKTEMTSAQLLDLFLIFGKDMVSMYFGFVTKNDADSSEDEHDEEH